MKHTDYDALLREVEEARDLNPEDGWMTGTQWQELLGTKGRWVRVRNAAHKLGRLEVREGTTTTPFRKGSFTVNFYRINDGGQASKKKA